MLANKVQVMTSSALHIVCVGVTYLYTVVYFLKLMKCACVSNTLIASNPAAEENAAWSQLFRVSQQFGILSIQNSIQIPRFLGIADSGETVESRPHFLPQPG